MTLHTLSAIICLVTLALMYGRLTKVIRHPWRGLNGRAYAACAMAFIIWLFVFAYT